MDISKVESTGETFAFVNGRWRPYADGNVYNEDDDSWFPAGDDQPIERTPISMPKAAILGGAQGATFGFADEIAAPFQAAYDSAGNVISGRDAAYGDMYDQNLQENRDLLDYARSEHPTTTMVGDVAGSVLSGGGAYRALGKYAPKTFLANVVAGGVEGGVGAYGRSTDSDGFVENAAVDIPMSMATAGGFHALSEFLGRASRTRQLHTERRRVQQARELDIQLTPAQLYDDRSLHQWEASMRSDPGFTKSFEAMDNANQTRVNQIASKAMGQQHDALTEVEMRSVAKNISNKFENAAGMNESIPIDAQWTEELNAIHNRYQSNWGKSSAPIDKVVEDALNTTDFTPKRYQEIYSGLGKDLDKAAKAGDGHRVQLYRDMRQSLDDLIDRKRFLMAPEYKEARGLYKAKKLIQKPGVLNSGSGDVSALKLGNRLNRDIKGYVEGGIDSELYNLARVSQDMKSNIGDSGTAIRSSTLADHLLGWVKQPIGDAYLAGKWGTSMLGPHAGQFDAAVMPATNAANAYRDEEEIRQLERELGLLP